MHKHTKTHAHMRARGNTCMRKTKKESNKDEMNILVGDNIQLNRRRVFKVIR